ncbi:MAG: TonB-dependent receptor [Emticicia sp.]|uniref:TonB-dependent receptor n=1 Tax=Emticicia sp. TaxID=1930953 RepID=UPI003BA64FE0
MYRGFITVVILIGTCFGVIAQSGSKNTPSASQIIRGKVVDFISEQPVIGASITVLNSKQGTQTDTEGSFSFGKMPIGRYQLQVSSVGYESQIISELLLESGKEMVLEIRLQATANQLAEAVVRAPSANLSGAVTSIQNITTEQIFRYPGTYLDPARLATAYAGVANSNDQANGMVVRGNSPNGVQWRLEGIEIVNPNHLSNAGTFSDRITQNSGGVNILSAQLLGNMNFLTGAFPAEYGNALSGVMDMRLRKGNDKKHEFTAQAGLIGIDLAAEGPMGKRGASYLINYRYSFTGLLATMGVKFGGEDIRFQDLAFNLNFPTKKTGTFTVFGMLGLSSNVFAAVRDASQWVVQKDGFDINYKNQMGAAGLTHSVNLGKRTLWRTAVVASGLSSLRDAYILSMASFARFPTDNDKSKKTKKSFSTSLSYKFNENNNLKVGVFVTHQYDELLSVSENTFRAEGHATGLVLQPYLNFHLSPLPKLSANLGLHYLNYTFNKTKSFEPRLSLNYQLSNNQSISVAYGLHSQLQPAQLYFAQSDFFDNNLTNAYLDLTKSHHYVLSHQYTFKKGSYFKTELYYQKIFNVPTFSGTSAFSALNIIEEYPSANLRNLGNGENYGIEFTYQQFLTNGFYALTNATLYRAYTINDGVRRNSRYNGKHIFNLTIGKEWERSKNRMLGASVRVVWLGGYYEREINEEVSIARKKLIYKDAYDFTVKQPDYFRPDFRIYLKKSRVKYSRTLALDIQNVAGYQNVSFSYYDRLQNKIVRQYQLGLIPILSYRWEF